MDKNTEVVVVNRKQGGLTILIPDLNVRKRFAKTGAFSTMTVGELEALKISPGGERVLKEYLRIEDAEVADHILDGQVEAEYNYGEKEIDFLLYKATTEQLLDALDFAPEGVLEIIRAKAIEKWPNTTDKLIAINEKFSISLEKIKMLQLDIIAEEKEVKGARRSKPVDVEVKPKRILKEKEADAIEAPAEVKSVEAPAAVKAKPSKYKRV